MLNEQGWFNRKFMKCRTDFELYCLLVSSYSNLKEPFQPQHFNKSQSWDLAYV